MLEESETINLVMLKGKLLYKNIEGMVAVWQRGIDDVYVVEWGQVYVLCLCAIFSSFNQDN